MRDGIIDPARWHRAPRRILFLLKEAYRSDGGGDFDLCELVRDAWKGPKYRLWHNLARWACGIQRSTAGSLPPFPEAADDLTEALLGSAVVNIKKSDGRSRSADEDLAQYAHDDGELLVRQIQMIDPEIVICGNTWRHYRSLCEHRKLGDMVYQTNGTPFVDFWHPAQQVHKKLSYYALLGAVQASPVLKPGKSLAA